MATKTLTFFVVCYTLQSFMMLLHDCRPSSGSTFPVYTTNSCPKNKIEWLKRSIALNCNETNGYMCIPNEKFTQLLELCYILPKVAIPKGVCLFFNKNISVVDAYDCQRFSSGCPNNHYFSDEIYHYQSCVSIEERHLLAETHYGKKDSIHPDVDERKYLIRIILGILIFAIIMSTLIPYFVIGDSSITFFKMFRNTLRYVQFGEMNYGLHDSKELNPIMTEIAEHFRKLENIRYE